MATGDVFAVKLHLTFAGQQCRPGFYLIEGTGGAGPDPVQACAADVMNLIDGFLLVGFSIATTCQGVEVQDLQPATTRTFFQPAYSTTAGTIADDNPVAPQDSMLIEWTTALKGGKGKFARRARTYMPGIYGTGQISGFLIPALQDALSACASLLFDRYVSDGTVYQMHAVAFVPGSKPRVISEVHPITAFAVDNVVAIQRRRRPGKGI